MDYGLCDKTRAEQDDAGGHFNPPQVLAGSTVKAAGYPPELGKEVVAPLDRIADLANTGTCFPAFGCLQAKAGTPGAFVCRPIAVGAVRLGARQAAIIHRGPCALGSGRAEH
ncbi:MAG: hypothetical protein AAB342_02760 [Chloroflexota bacterium]